jgi:allantoinase
MNVGLHCRLSRPGRIAGLAKFLEFAKGLEENVWFCTKENIADYWHTEHYPEQHTTNEKP